VVTISFKHLHIFLPLILFVLLFIFEVIQIRDHLISSSVATMYMHTDKYAVVNCFLNKKYTLFAIESIRFCPGYATVYLR
jgi:hypothetical protein